MNLIPKIILKFKNNSNYIASKEIETENKISKGIFGSKYIDNVAGLFAESNRWRMISILLIFLLFLSVIINLFEAVYFFNRYNNVRYFAGWEVSPNGKGVEPGEIYPDRVSNSYIQSVFESVAFKMSSWSYLTYEDNMKDLFEYYFSPNLVTEQQINIQQQGMLPLINSRKAVSIFTINRDKSVYKWCKEIDAACGYVVGHEKIDQGISPWKENDIAYFLIANQKIPTKKNGYFTLTITRLIRCESVEQCEIYLDGAQKGKVVNNSFTASSK